MTDERPEDRPLNIGGLLGLGLDGQDGHTRITKGESFYLHGGSEKTHKKMQETALRFSDEVDKRGKKLPEINARELGEITRQVRKKMQD
jgi:hypothetical protein